MWGDAMRFALAFHAFFFACSTAMNAISSFRVGSFTSELQLPIAAIGLLF